jgi:hypothetical protein
MLLTGGRQVAQAKERGVEDLKLKVQDSRSFKIIDVREKV